MHNPFAEVSWETAQRVPSATHMHLANQVQLENAYGMGFATFPSRTTIHRHPTMATHA